MLKSFFVIWTENGEMCSTIVQAWDVNHAATKVAEHFAEKGLPKGEVLMFQGHPCMRLFQKE